jgi:hypothetical protein
MSAEKEMKRLRIARDTWHAIAAVMFLVIVCLIGGLVVCGSAHDAEMLKLKIEHRKVLEEQARACELKLAGSQAQTRPVEEIAPQDDE